MAEVPRLRIPSWAVRAMRALALGAVLWLAWSMLSGQWQELRAQPLRPDPNWGAIAASCGIVLLTYALLVELWRRLLQAWGQQLRPAPAARVWFVSALGRYVPGRVWQIGAMALLAKREGVSAIAATGSAIVNTIVNIAAGMVVAVLTGAALLDTAMLRDGAPSTGALRPSEIALILAAAGFIGLIALPWILPLLARTVSRLTSRDVQLPPVRPATLWLLVAGHLAGWALYGIAFRLLALGVLGSVTGAVSAHVAVFTASYIIGYLALLTPGGLVVREVAMVAALTGAALMGPVEATVLAVASRIWLTALEVLPGAIFLALDALRTTSHRLPPDSVS